MTERAPKAPIPERIASFPNRQIIYLCPNCRTSFQFFGPSELFCHHCGQPIDWTNSSANCTEHFADIYHNSVSCGQQRRLMVQLDPHTGDIAKHTTPKENPTNEVQKNPRNN